MYLLSTEIIDDLLSLTASEEVSTFEVERLQDPLGSARWRSTSLLPNIVGQLAEAAAPDFWGLWYANAGRSDWARLRMADTQGNLTAAPQVDVTSYLWPGAGAGFHGAASFNAGGCEANWGDILDQGATDSFTLECRFKTTNESGNRSLFVKKATVNGIDAGFSLWRWGANSILAHVADGVTVLNRSTSGTYADGTWHHVAFVVDRTAQTIQLFVDGQSDSTTLDISSIGSLTNAQDLKAAVSIVADVDEYRFWSRALSAAEIAASYNGELDVTNPPYGLELYWRANEGTGTTAVDDSGNGRDGTITGGTWINVDPPAYPDLSGRDHVHQRSTVALAGAGTTFGNAIRFRGTGDVNFGDVLDFGAADSFTTQLRVRPKALGDVFVMKGNTPGDVSAGYGLWDFGGQIRFSLYDGATSASAIESVARPLDEWRQYTAVVDRSAQQMSLYVDGVLDAGPVDITAVGDLSSADSLYLARMSNGGRPLAGDLDELRIWSKALSPSEITANYNAELTTDPSGLELYWKANEGTGTTATDESDNGYDGTITNGIWINPTALSWFRIDYNFTGNPDGYVQGGALFLAPRVTLDFHQWEYLPEPRGSYEVPYAAGGLGRGGGMGKRNVSLSLLNLSKAQLWGQLAPLLWERQEIMPVGVVLLPDEATYPMDYIYYGYPSVRGIPEKRYFGTFEVDLHVTEP